MAKKRLRSPHSVAKARQQGRCALCFMARRKLVFRRRPDGLGTVLCRWCDRTLEYRIHAKCFSKYVIQRPDPAWLVRADHWLGRRIHPDCHHQLELQSRPPELPTKPKPKPKKKRVSIPAHLLRHGFSATS